MDRDEELTKLRSDLNDLARAVMSFAKTFEHDRQGGTMATGRAFGSALQRLYETGFRIGGED